MKNIDKNFKYENGNKVSFTGIFGKVEMKYVSEKTEDNTLFEGGEIEVIPSHIEAWLINEDDQIIARGEGLGRETALSSLYVNFAENQARIENERITKN